LHRKLALFRVPYALRATFIPSLRFGTGYASPYNPCHCLKLKNSKLNLLQKKNGIVAGTIVRDFGNFSKSFECDRNWWQICNFQTSRKNGFCI
ncbi:MAG: hypothetical protein PUJ82_04855, partial [Spirochaetales bacterium]|nr:hypothetical protein [Spirochaetales bacterium]